MIFFVVALGALLRLISIGQSFWLDEATSGIVVRDLSVREIFTNFTPRDFHPPLYYFLLKLWSQFFGTSEVALRSLSVLFAIGTIYLTFLITKRMFGKKVGIIAALFLATSPLHIYYSQEARMYSLETFFTVLSVFFFTQVGEGRKADWILFSASLVLLFFTDYLPISIILIFFIFGFLFHKKFSWWRSFLFSLVPLLLSVVLWLPIFIKQFKSGILVQSTNWADVLGRTTFKEVLLIPDKFIIGRISIENKLLYPTLLVILVLIFGFFIGLSIKKNLRREGNLIMLWLTIPTLIIILIGLKVSILSYFRLLFVLPAFYILLADGIDKAGKKLKYTGLAVVLLTNLVSSGVYLFNPTFHREDWRSLVSFIESNRTKNSQVLFVANSQMEGYRYYAKDANIGSPQSFNSKSSQIWLIRYVTDIYDPQNKFAKNIESFGFKDIHEYNFNGIPITRYEK